MEEFKDFISPELLVLIPVLYIIGIGAKKTTLIPDKFIPIVLGACGIILSCLWVLGTNGISIIGIFTAITQGILVAGASVYINQIIKQTAGKD